MLAQIILILALLLILVGLIMVLLDAFSEGILWGLSVLLVPPFAPVYSFIKWRKDQARNGFAMTLVGIAMVGVGLYGGGVQSIPGLSDYEIVNKLPTALPTEEPLPNEKIAAKVKLDEERDYDPLLSDDKAKYSSKEIGALAPKEDESVRSTGRAKVRRFPLAIEDLEIAVGSIIEVTFVDGETKRGNLIAYTEESLSLEEQLGGGSVSFEHNFEKIRSMALLVDPGAAPPPPLVEKQKDLTEAEERIVSSAPSTNIVSPQSNKFETNNTVDSTTAKKLPSSE